MEVDVEHMREIIKEEKKHSFNEGLVAGFLASTIGILIGFFIS